MAATTQLTTYSDLFTDLQNRVHKQTGITATENQAKRYINIALFDMHVGFSETFPWAERRGELITNPTYSDGTLSINQGSAALTGVGTAWNTNNINGFTNFQAGGKLQVSGTFGIYELLSIASDTAATLTSNFVGSQSSGSITGFSSGTNTTVTSAAHGLVNGMNVVISKTTNYNGVDSSISGVTINTFDIDTAFTSDDATGTWVSGAQSGASYTYAEDEYALATDFLRPVDQHQFGDRNQISLISRTEFRERFATSWSFGNPRIATMIDKTALGSSSPDTPVRRVALYPIPQQSLLIRYHYITSNLAISSAGAAQTQLSADADEPIVPLRYRHAILFHALYHWYRDREDDPRSQVAKQEYTDLVLRIAGDTEIGGRRARLVPRLGSYTRRARRPYSGSPGRFDKNGAFDRLEDIR